MGRSNEAPGTTRRTALIVGVSGQDGAYLSRLLLDRGYDVHGTSRDAQASTFANLTRLGIRERVTLWSMSTTDFRSVLQVLLRVQPAEVYNLSGQSSVGLSFDQPVETLESIATGTLNLLEAIRFSGLPVR
jgi:GDPmannose 4,6-dehydratase